MGSGGYFLRENEFSVDGKALRIVVCFERTMAHLPVLLLRKNLIHYGAFFRFDLRLLLRKKSAGHTRPPGTQ